jgi:hypothetical protein
MWREEGTDQNKHLVVVTYFTVFPARLSIYRTIASFKIHSHNKADLIRLLRRHLSVNNVECLR